MSAEQIDNPLLHRLLYYLSLREGGCPIERHELTDREWLALAELMNEREKHKAEQAEVSGDN